MAIKIQNPKSGAQSGSAYWLGRNFLEKSAEKSDVIKLASYKKAVGNFVNIVTGRNDIKVKYSTGNQSFTDGKTVVLSAKFNSINDFDVAVGLSLHEGSHCLLSDFTVLSTLLPFRGWLDIQGENLRQFLGTAKLTGYVYNVYADKFSDWRNHRLDLTIDFDIRNYRLSVLQYLTVQAGLFKDIINIVEDRRIDRFVLDTAPGYTSYYNALYNEYFTSRTIDRLFDSKTLREVNWKSYMFCLTNIMNPKFNTNLLPRLDEIADAFDWKNIDRLKTTMDSVEVAKTIFQIIADVVPMPEFDVQPTPTVPPEMLKQNNKNENTNSGSENDDENLDMPESVSSDSQAVDNDSDETDNNSNENGDESDENGNESDENGDESDEDMGDKSSDDKDSRSLDKILNKQTEFARGTVKKTKIRKEISDLVDAASESDSEYIELSDLHVKNIKVLVAHGISESIVNSKLFKSHVLRTSQASSVTAVEDGVRLGTMLGKRLKTRDEDRTLKTSRLESGRIDRRLIAELGFNNARIFQNILHSSSKPASIHLSIDASGSMVGQKWQNALTSAIAIAKAADMIQSIDCSISIRGNYDQYTPLMWVVYDSRKDKFQNFRRYASHLYHNASTPEGLCFEAIQKEIIETSKGKDSFFVNFSDGEPIFYLPGYGNYSNQTAVDHTKKQVSKLRAAGITCLSYFIHDGDHVSDRLKQNFSAMYGSAASYVNVTNLLDLTKTINLMFERKIS